MVNEYNNRVKAGEIFKPDEYYSGFLEGFDITFKEVSPEYYAEYFGWANWLYKGKKNFKVLQFIYPDTSGVWPWDPEASTDFKWFFCLSYMQTNKAFKADSQRLVVSVPVRFSV
ncbi:DUF4262 domain-containing protein [Vibrio sinaloensis]|nr:DUF4262 domain-containing protein [Vibrio sinaloensis]